MIMIMHCPHAVPNCPTCENSAAAHELRDLRRVARAAQRLIDAIEAEGSLCRDRAAISELAVTLTMARETSTFLPLDVTPTGGGA